jgi:hypothetical protein
MIMITPRQDQRVIGAQTDQVLITDHGKLLYLNRSAAQTLTAPVVRRLDGASPGFTVDVYNAGPENLTIVPRAGQTVQGGTDLTVASQRGVRLTLAPGGADWIVIGA